MSAAILRHACAAIALVALGASLLPACGSTCYSNWKQPPSQRGPNRPPIDERDAGDAGRFRDGSLRGCRRPVDGGPLYPEGTFWKCDETDMCPICTTGSTCTCFFEFEDAGPPTPCSWLSPL